MLFRSTRRNTQLQVAAEVARDASAGGDLTDLMVSHLLGRDAQGNLYGSLNHWSGMAQFVEGEGLLGTRVFRLQRSKPGGGP